MLTVTSVLGLFLCGLAGFVATNESDGTFRDILSRLIPVLIAQVGVIVIHAGR